jgi:hypothetical protein
VPWAASRGTPVADLIRLLRFRAVQTYEDIEMYPQIRTSNKCSLTFCNAISVRTGQCPKGHGVWFACGEHKPLPVEPPLVPCPICQQGWRDAKDEEQSDEEEAKRRNFEQTRREMEDLPKYEDQFRSQGYGSEAAQALAKKKFLTEGGPLRKWTVQDISAEREAREYQRQIAVGERMECPKCGGYAPVSQGVILAHDVGSWDQHIWCQGEGTIVAEK